MVVKSFRILCLCKPLVISTRYMSKQVKKPRLSPSVALRDNGRSGREASTSSSGTGPSRRKLPSRNVKQTESDRSTSSNTASVTDNVVFRTEDIDKSPNDSKSYRHIELRNGLRALLITDPNEGGSSTTVTGSDGSKSDTTSSGEEEEEDDKSVKLSAAGLCIGTGSFCDPREAQGLAHFLEHMVFMGSEKYPEENAYDSFIKKHGGDDNASTDCEKTLFYFDIQHEVFREALDMFSQFFINPLLKQSSMSREIQAIESEFEQSITSDFVRKQQLKAYMATEGHPVGTFMWGNTQSLMGGNKAEGLHARLQEFHRHMYSAQYMTLAVQADESLDKLEKWVAETFSKIPNNGAPRKDFSTSGPVFDESRFCKLYRVVPVKNVNQIEITWSVPSQHRHFRSKPLGYLSFLIGHESEGSILSYLKKKCWALGLYGGTGDSGFEHNTANALFTITITLTEDGLTNYQYVLMAVFQYLAMLKREGPQQHIYEEIKLVDEIDFVWQEECDPTENVEDLCSEMQLYPPKYYLSGSSLLLDYEPQIIQDCLERLSPRTCNIMILSKTFEEEKICDRVEPWYKTQYSVSEIDPSWIRQWQNLKKNEDFHLPPPNKFIATDFELKTATIDTTMKEVHKPVLILNNEQSRLWYKKNNKFNVPKAYIFFHLITPLANQTPQTMVLFDLFVRILKQNLTEKTYPADLAQLWYDFKGVETGLSIKLGGFDHKLSKLFEVIVDNLVEFDTSQDMFDAVKDQVSREYFNHFLRPARLITDLRLSVLQQKYWSAVDKRCFVSQITREMLLSFVQEFKLKLYIEGLVIGNMSAEEALKLEEYLCGKLKCAVLPRNTRPEPRCVQLPTGNFHCCRVENFNKEDVNSSVIHYYQLEPSSIRGTALCDLANTCMEEPCFDILRTREQLGYSVWCTSHLTNGILGLSLNVETSTSKFSLDQVDEKMTSFLQNFGHTLASMSNSQFKNHVKALTGLKKKEETNLNEEADKYWIEILSQNYIFDRMEKEIKALSTLTKSDLVHWYKANITNKDRHRKLCIQVQGSTTGSPSVDLSLTPRPPLRRYSSISCHGIKVSQNLALRTQQRNEAIERGGIWDLNYLNVGKVPLKNCIMDISSFKRRLPVYPVHKGDT